MLSVTNDFKTALTQPRQIDAKVVVNNSTTLDSTQLNSIQREFNTDLFKTIVKKVEIDSNVSMNKGDTIVPSMGLLVNDAFEYLSLGTFKVKDAPELNKDTNSYQISTYDKIVECMVPYDLTSSDITYPCTVRQLFVAIFTKLGWSTSGIPSTFVNSTSQIEEDVYSNMNMTYRDVLDELCTISCMFLADKNGVPTLYQKTTTSETINEEFMKDTNVVVKNRVFFNSLVFSRASESDNIYRKDDTSIANNGLHEFKVSNLQILSLNWRDNFIDAMWDYIKTFEYYAFEIDTIGIGYLEPVDAFTLSTFNTTYNTLLLNDDLTIRDGISERIYADEPKENETDYRYASDTDKKINQTNLIVDKQNGVISAVVSRVDTIENDIDNPTTTLSGTSFDIEDALDQPLQDFKMYGNTYQDGTPTPSSPQEIHNVSGDNTIEICGKNIANFTKVNSLDITNGSVDLTQRYSSGFTATFYIDEKTLLAGNYTLCFKDSVAGSGNSDQSLYYNSSTSNYLGNFHLKTTKFNYCNFTVTETINVSNFRIWIPTGYVGTLSEIMLVKETITEPPTYEAYTGNSQLISLGVENLIDNTNNKISGAYIRTGQVDIRSNSDATTFWAKVEPNTQYTFSRDKGNRLIIGGSNTQPTLNGSLDTILYDGGTSTATTYTFTNGNYQYLAIYVSLGESQTPTWVQLEKGTKANSYSEYGKPYIELNKIGTYQDYIYKTDKWYLHKEIGKQVLVGTENWQRYSASPNYVFYINDSIYHKGSASDNPILCDKFIPNFANTDGSIYLGGSNRLAICTSITTELSNWKTWLASNNVIVYFALETPQEIEITDTTLLEQLNNLMTIPLIKDLTHIIIAPNDLTPTLSIEYLRNTSINENFVRQPQLESYYTKVETDAQIEISSNQIQSTVSELQTQVDSNGDTISSVSNQVQNLQTSTSTQINTINQTLEDGVSKLTNSLVTIDINGINTSRADETFNTQITNKTFEVRDGDTELTFIGYDTDEQRTVARIDTLESKRATIGVHRTEVITRSGVKRTAGFYVGGGN